jgi:hypothetical protein
MVSGLLFFFVPVTSGFVDINISDAIFLRMKSILMTKYLGNEEMNRLRIISETVSSENLTVDKDWNIKYPKIEEMEEGIIF